MSRFGYIWIFVCMAISLSATTYELTTRDQVIRQDTKRALYVGTYQGCVANNHIRDQVWNTATALAPGAESHVKSNLKHDPCRKLARDIVQEYLHGTP